MSRVIFATGAKGDIIRGMQSRLSLPPSQIDGQYGNITAQAVSAFQTANGFPSTGEVDEDTWANLMQAPIPQVKERALQLTAAFEGHGFSLAQGNFDGAGITWGIIGFTLAGGELPRILKQTEADHPGMLEDAFGDSAAQLLAILDASPDQQIAFADGISLGASKAALAEPWLSGFRRLGEQPAVQQLQLSAVDRNYFQPALVTAGRFNLIAELGIALAFDIHVQNGGISAAAARQIQQTITATPPDGEQDLRVAIANAVADTATNVQFREDVRQRKMTVATGSGQVHGGMFVLRNWGLSELPFPQAT
ncbi:MAG: peptidoglycan-binding protein [Candidatus Sulfopaludibacter sp.]|nr:peptidoglycan-binding protein [Candidatus Sulfopaludibacter sp.]